MHLPKLALFTRGFRVKSCGERCGVYLQQGVVPKDKADLRLPCRDQAFNGAIFGAAGRALVVAELNDDVWTMRLRVRLMCLPNNLSAG